MHGQPGLGLLSRNRISQIPVTFVTSALRGGDAEEEKYGVRWDGIRGGATCWAPPERINHLCFPIRWRDGFHRDSSKPAAESQGPRSDTGLPKARAGSDHVGMSILWKLWGKAWFLGAGQGPRGTVLSLTG